MGVFQMCNRNVGGSSRYLVSCFQQCFWENIFKFLIYEGVEAYYVSRSSSFLLNQYVFLIFKVSVIQSTTWVIFTELIWTSLIQICIYIFHDCCDLWKVDFRTNQWDVTVQYFGGRSSFLCSKRRGALIWLDPNTTRRR